MGLIALTAAFLSPSIASVIDPPPRPAEEATIDFATKLYEAAKAKAENRDYVSSAPAQPAPSRFLFPVIISLGMIAAAMGLIGLLRDENRLFSGGAIALGVGAATVQFSLLLLALIFFLLVLFIIASVLGLLG